MTRPCRKSEPVECGHPNGLFRQALHGEKERAAQPQSVAGASPARTCPSALAHGVHLLMLQKMTKWTSIALALVVLAAVAANASPIVDGSSHKVMGRQGDALPSAEIVTNAPAVVTPAAAAASEEDDDDDDDDEYDLEDVSCTFFTNKLILDKYEKIHTKKKN